MKDKDYTPKTEKELASWMHQNCYNFSSYSIDGNSIYEGYGIEKGDENSYFWYFTERGQKQLVKKFDTEEEIVAYAYNQIKSDDYANCHCIGFTCDEVLVKELIELLEKENIRYTRDTIPYYGAGNPPLHRIFVYGCDINKTKHLREKYMTDLKQ